MMANKRSPSAAQRSGPSGSSARPPGRIILISLVLFLLAGAALIVFRPFGSEGLDLSRLAAPGAARGHNLLLITLDTTRCDHLGCYGYKQAVTPAIDSLAAPGVLFTDAVTSVPLTLPSHATMLTGLYPPRHGVRDNGTFQLAAEQDTFAELLSSNGYETAAFVGSFVLEERFGLNQGFDTYDFEVSSDGFYAANVDFSRRNAGAVSDAAIAWLQQRQSAGRTKPFFLWVHYFDAHIPHQSPFTSLPAFAGRPYDAQIAYVDSHVQRLLAEIDSLKLRETTLIACVSDHGEGLSEHGEPTHGMLVYESTMHAALILSHPGLFHRSSRIEGEVVGLVDLRPTLADLLGLPETAGLDGRSLLRGHSDPQRAIYMETMVPLYSARCSPLYGLRRHQDKYVRAPEAEYFDLRRDPRELNNLLAARANVVTELDQQLEALLDKFAAAGGGEGARREMTSDEIDRLAALGYVHAPPVVESGDLPDAKAMIRSNQKSSEAIKMFKRGDAAGALRLAQEAVAECPGFADAAVILAQIHEQSSRPADAMATLRASIEINPRMETILGLARQLMIAKQYEEMETVLQRAQSLHPGNGFIHILRGDRLGLQGRLTEALDEYRTALRVDEQRIGPIVRPQIERLEQMVRPPGRGVPPGNPTPASGPAAPGR